MLKAMELRQLRSFIAVAEELNFTRAAVRCHLAQPSLTRQIRLLEEELGVELFDRSRRQIRLTEAGRIFLEDTRRSLAALEQAVRKVRRTSGAEPQRLRVAAPVFAMYGLVPRILHAFSKGYPQIPLELHELYSVDAVLGLKEGWLELGFLRADTVPAGLAWQSVERIEMMVFLPAQHPLAALGAVPFPALADEPFILLGRHAAQNVSQSYRELVVGWCRRAGFEPRITQSESWVQSDSAIIRLVASGVGVHLALPSPQSQALPPEVVSRPIINPAPYLELVAAWRQGEDSPALRAFVEVIRETALAAQ